MYETGHEYRSKYEFEWNFKKNTIAFIITQFDLQIYGLKNQKIREYIGIIWIVFKDLSNYGEVQEKKILSYHFNNFISNTGKITLLQVEQNDTLFEEQAYIEQ